MHIVQALVSLNIGGSELVATELSEFLVARGNRVTVVASDGPIGERVRACGAEHLDWPIGKKRLSTLRFIGRFSDWLADERPEIVHVHSRFPAWICWAAIRRLDEGVRPLLVTTMHGHYSVTGYSSVMARGRKTIAVSEHIRRYTLQNYPAARAGDVITIHGGASREDFPYAHQPPAGWREEAETEYPALRKKRWLLLPGRVTRWKGHVDFIHLLSNLSDLEDVHGLIVGGCRPGSRYLAELESLAEKTGVGNRITFTGDRLDIRDWMAASELVFNLSNDPPEAFGRTVLETLCLGRPMIAWGHGGAAEILAAMFPEGAIRPLDFQELEMRTRRFLRRPPHVPESDAFTLNASMNRHLQVYEDMIRESIR